MYLNSNREKILKYILLVIGIFSVTASLYISFAIYFSVWDTSFITRTFKIYHLILLGGYFGLTLFTGFNKSFFKRRFYGEFVTVLYHCFFMVAGLILLLFWLHGLIDSRRLIFAYFVLFFIVTETVLRALIKFVLLKVYFNSKFSSKLFVITDRENLETVVNSLTNNLDWSRQICGLCVLDSNSDKCASFSLSKLNKSESLNSDEDETDKSKNSELKNSSENLNLNLESLKNIENIGHICSKDNLLNYLTTGNVDEVFIYTGLIYSDAELKETISKAEEMGIRVNIRINLDMFDFLPKSYTKIDRIGKYHCVSISRNYVSYRSRFMKHLLDYVGGFVGFLIFAAVFIVLGPIIKLDSKGPVLFAQNRVGRNGRIFKCYKFRSMRQDAEELKKTLMAKNEMSGLMFKMENDPRITKVGRFIRKTSIDELPQFINVLKGDMSLVGTRPPTVDEYEQYEPKHRARVSMMPGLTGLWQVSGRSNIKDFDEVVKLDMEYIDNSSFWFDVKIILMTVKVVLFGKGAK